MCELSNLIGRLNYQPIAELATEDCRLVVEMLIRTSLFIYKQTVLFIKLAYHNYAQSILQLTITSVILIHGHASVCMALS